MDQLLDAKPAANILIVDDQPENLRILEILLSKLGYRVRAASGGAAALSAARWEAPDLILLDVMMPEMDGFEVLSRLKQDDELHHVPVIIVSAIGDMDKNVKGIEMGAEDYLIKPFNYVLLRARIIASLEKKEWHDREKHCLQRIEMEKKRADDLLSAIFPEPIVEELKWTNDVRPRLREDVSVLFADIVDFTRYCETHSPETVIGHLQELVEECELICQRCGLQKIKTVGDAFMAVAGLFDRTANPVLDSVRAAREMVEAARALPANWQLRVGIHVGPVIAGIVGRRQYQFDVWGDTVNTAHRLADHGDPGAVNLSQEAWQHVSDLYRAEPSISLPPKGKAVLDVMQIVP